MTAHRLPRDLAFNDYHVRRDPGAGGRLHSDMSLVSYALDSTTTETRTIGSPQRAGVRLTITHNSGTKAITLKTEGTEVLYNATGTTGSHSMASAGKFIDLVSARIGGKVHWLVTNSN